ncbi:adaptin amino-terminal region protein [Rhizoctonia solani]|uniref:Adaptin amino-terminal region protein n=1 Tax=Rhizoctonia solani TaxID=456999 RepID=A0A8H8NP08_9AGAM|nr:adaptin amino-terminal region protein [Rhizoctonia solani]QRW17311.1 adaptin amino-terminal region protein [Rhizoctonia solani]
MSSGFDDLTLCQDQTAANFQATPSTSMAACHSAFEKQQEKDTIPIYNSHPYKRTDISIQLFHLVFDFFYNLDGGDK